MTGATIPGILSGHKTVVVAGSGGVGKTTVAAALGNLAARSREARVLVLTVDPARRLATALGVVGVEGEPRLVDSSGRGELWMAMLDARQEWDRLIERHAPDKPTRDAIMRNHLYDSITRRFAHSHEYAAMERLHQFQTSGEWDLIVLDTPPSRNALDLLDAPRRMRDFFSGRLLGWLTVPATSRFTLQAFRPFRLVADRILGGPFIADLTDFFVLIKTMEKGFVERATEVENSLSDESTVFVVVTTPEVGPVEEAARLVGELDRRNCPTGAIVVNRSTPRIDGGDRLVESPTVAELRLFERIESPELLARVVDVMYDTLGQMRHAAALEASLLEALPGGVPTVALPMMQSDIADLEGVVELADRLAASPVALA